MIPDELKELRQWVVARADKVPLNPADLTHANVSDPKTWGTYDAAVSSRGKDDVCHIGFVLTSNDPYTIIDLDAPQDDAQQRRMGRILAAFDTYTERSQSGKGYHIVVRGNVPAGARRDRVEVYSTGRYMIFTGDEVWGPRNIATGGEALATLYREAGGTVRDTALVDGGETRPDWEINEMAEAAENGAKYLRLCRGEWQSDYPSQSEADFALLNILCFYTRNNAQVRRLFRYSKLGRRPKAQRDSYLDTAIKKIRTDQGANVDLTKIELPPVRDDVARPHTGGRDLFPPGLVGAVAEYIYASSVRPVAEVALAGALGAMAGVCGRAYNISGTGLNQYLILLAPTGRGKEGAATGIEALFAAARNTVPVVDDFRGPGAFASGQALVRTVSERPCFVSVLGEVGLLLQNICSPQANSAEVMLRRVLLDLYTKSGATSTLAGSAYSDREKSVGSVRSPAVTILGEGTPESFYGGLSDAHILEGLIPRFTVVSYDGPRPARNRSAFFPPPDNLVVGFCDVVASALAASANSSFCNVGTTASADKLLDEIDAEADDTINSSEDDVLAQLWNRAHLKALKLAALVAVGVDHHGPVVGDVEAKWATDFVRAEVADVAANMQRGSGGNFAQQEEALRKLVATYLNMPPAKRNAYNPPRATLGEPVVPLRFLAARASRLKCFHHHVRSPREMVDNLLSSMVREGTLVRVPEGQAQEQFNTSQPLYAPGEGWDPNL